MAPKNIKKAERIYSALYLLSIVFETYAIELQECLTGTDETPEIIRLEKAIAEVVSKTDLRTKKHRQVISIIKDHENLKSIIDGFMKL